MRVFATNACGRLAILDRRLRLRDLEKVMSSEIITDADISNLHLSDKGRESLVRVQIVPEPCRQKLC